KVAGRCPYGIEPLYYLPYRHPAADNCKVPFAFLDLDAGLGHNLSLALAEGKWLGDGGFFRYLDREASMSHGNRRYPNMFTHDYGPGPLVNHNLCNHLGLHFQIFNLGDQPHYFTALGGRHLESYGPGVHSVGADPGDGRAYCFRRLMGGCKVR